MYMVCAILTANRSGMIENEHLILRSVPTERLRLRNFPLVFCITRCEWLHRNSQNPIVCDIAIAIAQWEWTLTLEDGSAGEESGEDMASVCPLFGTNAS